jgi:opacity protein-like surface antigen
MFFCLIFWRLIMKKIILGIALVMLLPAVHAEDGGESSGDKHHYEGWYLGFGAHTGSAGESVDYEYPTGQKNRELRYTAPRVGGTLLLGVGKKVKRTNLYVSVEGGADFGPNTEKVEGDKMTADGTVARVKTYNLRSETNGISPYVKVRVGGVNHNHGFLVYAMLGVAHQKSSEHTCGDMIEDRGVPIGVVITKFDSQHKTSGFGLVTGVGVEKGYGKNTTVRTELEYKQGRKSKKTWAAGDSVTLKQNDSVTIRLMVSYHGALGKLWHEVSPL